MHRLRRTLLVAASAAATLLGACMRQDTVTLITLKVSASGQYQVNGKTVGRTELESALVAMRPKEGVLGIHLQADKQATYESVQFAVALAQKLGAKVGIVGNEQF